jgi:hypothetical protein
MGAVHATPLAELTLALQKQFDIENFVETGTYMGQASGWAAGHFKQVWTIEIREDFQREAKQRTGEPVNVRFLLGNSGERLKEVCGELGSTAIFWLDAHAGAGFFGDHDDCPLIDEIDIITSGPTQHFLLIDDARAFYAPPPPPFDYRKWPALDDVMAHLQAHHHYHVVLLVDCLICVPPAARELMAQFAFAVRPKI